MEQLPAWNNSSEYQEIASADYVKDYEEVQNLTRQMEELSSQLSLAKATEQVKVLQQAAPVYEKVTVLLANLSTYTYSEKSLDSKNELAKKWGSKIQQAWSTFSVVFKPFESLLIKMDEVSFQDYLKSPQTQDQAFSWGYQRRLKSFLLSNEEEKTLEQFSSFGKRNWGELYSSMSGSLKVHLPSTKTEIGLAEAAGRLRGGTEAQRKEVWEGIQAAWKTIEIPCASVLNNLSGYRLEEYKKRSHTHKLHFLDTPLFEARIEAKTLESMMSAVQERIAVPRRALKSIAKALGKNKLDPWDLQAPAPIAGQDQPVAFSEAIAMIRDAFGSVNPKMGEFVDMMVEKNWIDARVLPNKSPGAYCTGFAKSRTPRVFQTYMGSMKDISTLAHELGHAYHGWVLRELPRAQTEYPMTLAETASIFSETLLSERLFEKAGEAEKFVLGWENAFDAVALLVNIPARFDFEKSLYEAREKGPLSAQELNTLTRQAWEKWYGDTMSSYEDQFWMTKLHFSIAGISFYNYPYTFGYLFGLGIYAQKDKLGDKFHEAYVNILKDTGRMTAEDLIQKHLGMDIRQPKFWLDSLDMVEKKIEQFEKMIK
jgi:oligoendopeptidase F